MSSAKRTPRYVEAIPRNLRIVGPTIEAQVIPIRRITPAYTPVIETPAAPMPAPRRSTRKVVPLDHRPWRVLLVSPIPGAQTRSFGVRPWQARVAVAALCLGVVLAGGAMAAFVVAFQSPDLFATSADAALLREELLDSSDSLALLRTELAAARAATTDSAVIAAAARISTSTTAERLAARKPVSPIRAPRVAASDRVALAPRSMEGLPVHGVISSTFSRSRRHPILHIRRPHLGVDIAAPRGTRISAPAPGTVTFVGHKFGFGLVVEVQHTPTVKSRYAHMRAATVKVGDQVARGDQLGAVGSSGITTGPHLHFEVIVNGRQVDPLRYRLPQPAPAMPAVPLVTTLPVAGAPPAMAGAMAPEDSASPPPPSEQDSASRQQAGAASH